MEISPTRLARCTNRHQVLNDPDPMVWIRDVLPLGWHTHSFHFIVRWTLPRPVISATILMSKLVDFSGEETPYKVDDDRLLKLFSESPASQEMRQIKQYAQGHGLSLATILLPEIPTQAISYLTPSWMVGEHEDGEMRISRTTVGKIREAIRRHRGGAAAMGTKGLNYGTSSVECYLSKTEEIFPGDVDCIIADVEGNTQAIIEFKKHTLMAPISNHLATRYYPDADGRKYQSIYALTLHLRGEEGKEIPLVILYFTKKEPSTVRLQTVSHLDQQEIRTTKDSGDIATSGLTSSDIGKTVLDYI